MSHKGGTILILALLWSAGSACATDVVTAKQFASYEELQAGIRSAAGAGDAFWNRVLAHKTMPLIFGERAVFLWRGSAQKVEWRGDFSLWDPSPEMQGKQIGATGIWWCERSFPKDTRLDYKLVLNGDDWQLDPLNPYQQIGGYGPNSEVRMPLWKPPSNIVPREGLQHGKLTTDIPFDSTRLGYSVNYRVYTPAGAASNLPVLFVTDGSDYWRDEMGGLVITLDNLIADRKMTPILVVFIDPWDRKENVNRRKEELIPGPDRACPFCEFIVDELLPVIGKSYATARSRERRGILGTSLGGVHATLMATRYGTVFGLVAIQSPASWRSEWVIDEAGSANPLPAKAFIDVGVFEGDMLQSARKLRDTWSEKKVDIRYLEVNDGHSWGHWRATLADMLEFLFPYTP